MNKRLGRAGVESTERVLKSRNAYGNRRGTHSENMKRA